MIEKNNNPWEKKHEIKPMENNKFQKESPQMFSKNIFKKINKFLATFRAEKNEILEIEASVGLNKENVELIKEETKIEEAMANIENEMNDLAMESKSEIENVVEKSENDIVADKAKTLIGEGDFELARENLLLISDTSIKEDLVSSNRSFFEYYENYEINKSKKWLDDERNQVNVNFDAKEGIKNILKQPSGEERKKALSEYKSNLVRQKEALTNFELYLESFLKNKRDISEKDFLVELSKYGEKYSFSEEQKQEYVNVFNKFKTRKEFINDAKEKFSNDNDLFEFFSLKKPEGKIQVLYRSGTIAFRCEKLKDFNALMIRGTNDKPNVEKMVGFCATRKIEDFRSDDPENNGITMSVIGELIEGEFNDINSYSSSSILVHEEQHAIRSLFSGPKDKQREFREDKFSDSKARQTEINHVLDYKSQKQSLNQGAGLADEILARVRERSFNLGDIGRELKNYDFKEQLANGDSKDILKEKFDQLFSDDRKVAANNKEAIDKFEIELVDEHLRHYLANRYEKNVENAIDAVNSLYKNYSNHQICSLLMNENIFDWPKISRRLTESN